jgi:hypothetical protein
MFVPLPPNHGNAQPNPAPQPIPTPPPQPQQNQPPPPPQTPPNAAKPKDDVEDLGSAEMIVPQIIRWQVENPYKFLDQGGREQVEKTIKGIDESLTRTIASKIEMDPLIGLKLEIGNCVRSILQKDDDQLNQVSADLTPWMTIPTGVVIVVVMIMLSLLSPWNVWPTILLVVLSVGFGLAGMKRINHKHMGVMTILGKRYHIFLDEGLHWLPWLVFGAEIVDMRQQHIDLTAKDKAIRVIAGNADDAGDKMPPRESISSQIDEQFREISGVNVLQVINTEIMPANEEILRARERKIQEKAISDAQDLDFKRQGERIKNFVKDTGVDATEVFKAVQAQEDKLARQEVIVSGAGQADTLIGGIIAAAQAIRGQKDQQQNQNRGKRKGK